MTGARHILEQHLARTGMPAPADDAPGARLADYMAGATRQWHASLKYVEDFTAAHRATLRDPLGRASLTYAYQQARADGKARGGEQCCGTTSEWHRPWCETGPRRYRDERQHTRVDPAARCGTGTIDGAVWRPGDPVKHLYEDDDE